MSTVPAYSRAIIVAVVVLLSAFAIAFHFGHKQRLAVAPIQDSATQFFRIALLPRAYAQAHEGLWPPLDDEARTFALPLQVIPHGYTVASRFTSAITGTVPAILLGSINNAGAYALSPVDLQASSYIYFGYAVTNDDEFMTLVKSVHSGVPLDENIVVEAGHGTLGSPTLYRIENRLDVVLNRDGVLKSGDAEILSRIPVLMERPRDGYAWVMYLNMKMERLPYPGAFPMSDAVVDTLKNSAATPQ